MLSTHPAISDNVRHDKIGGGKTKLDETGRFSICCRYGLYCKGQHSKDVARKTTGELLVLMWYMVHVTTAPYRLVHIPITIA
jgi:hypothetical protein